MAGVKDMLLGAATFAAGYLLGVVVVHEVEVRRSLTDANLAKVMGEWSR